MYAEAGEAERYRQDAAGTTAGRSAGDTAAHTVMDRAGHTGAGRTLAVVLNWCAEEDTERCLASLLHECERVPTLDLLLVDSASPDGSGARLAARFPAVPYLALTANLGYAGGNEQAIAWALARRYDFVLIVNDDAELMAGCVEQLLETMAANPTAGACAPTVTFGPPHTDRVWWAGGAFVWWKGLGVHWHDGESVAALGLSGRAPQPVTFLSGCVLLLRSHAIRQSGSLRAEFFAYVEDAELSYRWQRDGWQLYWVPAALARHHVPRHAGAPSPFAIRYRDRNRRRVASLHYGVWRRAGFWLFFAPSRLLRLMQYALKADGARAIAVWRGWFGR